MIFYFNYSDIFNHPSVYLLESSSINGWASMKNFEQKLFIPHLGDKPDLLESTKPTNEGCSVIYRYGVRQEANIVDLPGSFKRKDIKFVRYFPELKTT